jgi:flavin reductase (DIM6/NTAB) family NADH-FMN oxidoreductase RutF
VNVRDGRPVRERGHRAQLEAMNATSAEVEPDVDEFELAGLEPVPSTRVNAPLRRRLPGVLECEVRKEVELDSSNVP